MFLSRVTRTRDVTPRARKERHQNSQLIIIRRPAQSGHRIVRVKFQTGLPRHLCSGHQTWPGFSSNWVQFSLSLCVPNLQQLFPMSFTNLGQWMLSELFMEGLSSFTTGLVVPISNKIPRGRLGTHNLKRSIEKSTAKINLPWSRRLGRSLKFGAREGDIDVLVVSLRNKGWRENPSRTIFL